MKTTKDNVIHFEATDRLPSLKELLSSVAIEQIYVGKDHHCRCGCGGNYYTFGQNSPLMKRFITRADNLFKENLRYCEMVNTFETNWINIPSSFEGSGKCICIYFKGKINF